MNKCLLYRQRKPGSNLWWNAFNRRWKVTYNPPESCMKWKSVYFLGWFWAIFKPTDTLSTFPTVTNERLVTGISTNEEEKQTAGKSHLLWAMSLGAGLNPGRGLSRKIKKRQEKRVNNQYRMSRYQVTLHYSSYPLKCIQASDWHCLSGVDMMSTCVTYRETSTTLPSDSWGGNSVSMYFLFAAINSLFRGPFPCDFCKSHTREHEKWDTQALRGGHIGVKMTCLKKKWRASEAQKETHLTKRRIKKTLIIIHNELYEWESIRQLSVNMELFRKQHISESWRRSGGKQTRCLKKVTIWHALSSPRLHLQSPADRHPETAALALLKFADI